MSLKLLQESVWNDPNDYAGERPRGAYVLAGQNRDSPPGERRSFEQFQQAMKKARDALPKTQQAPADCGPDGQYRQAWWYVLGAQHWAVGWVEMLILRPDAPRALLRVAARGLARRERWRLHGE